MNGLKKLAQLMVLIGCATNVSADGSQPVQSLQPHQSSIATQALKQKKSAKEEPKDPVIVRSVKDPRIAFVGYTPDRVIDIPVQIGVFTSVEVGDDESIQFSSTGWGADCKNEDSVWCVSVPPGMPVMYVQPRDCKAPYNRSNVHILTKDRVGKVKKYRMSFYCVPRTGMTIHAIQFRYELPAQAPKQATAGMVIINATDEAVKPVPSERQEIQATEPTQQPKLKDDKPANTDYTVVVGQDSEELVPRSVTDNGIDTFITMQEGAPIPAVFRVVAGSETEVLVRTRGRVMTVEGVADSHLLRMNEKVVRIVRARKIDPKDRLLNRVERVTEQSNGK